MSETFWWDGVIVDSSLHHEESWERLARETGFTLPEGHFRKGFGMKNEFIIPNLLNWSNRAEEIRELSLATTNRIETLKGADLAVHRLDELSVNQVAALVPEPSA
jgi:beta-phosphoglucomutase-like phosphatase (HAD superfamily)